MTDPRRQHPLAMIQSSYNYIILLLFPLLRSLTLLRGGLALWLQGIWMDGLLLSCIVLFGFLRWRADVWQLTGDILVCRKGIFLRAERRIDIRRLSSFTTEAPFWLRPFRAVRVRLDTDAGSRKEPDIRLLLRRDDADRLLSAVRAEPESRPLIRCYTPNSRSVAFLSFVTSDSLTGVLFAAALISQTGRILGEEAEERLITEMARLVRLLAVGLPPAAAMIAALLVGGWLLDFLSKLIRHLGFSAARDGDRLIIRSGILVVRESCLSVDRIHFLQLRQSLLTWLLGFASVMIGCTGYGKNRGELAVLFPAGDRVEVRRGLDLLLPEIRPGWGGCRPERKALSRFLIPPVSLIACLLAALWLLSALFPDGERIILFLGLMVLLAAVWWLLVKLAAFRFTGAEMKGETCTLRSVFGYAFFTTSFSRDRVACVRLRQSLFQRMKGCCDLTVFLRSERRRRFTVQNIPLADGEELLRKLSGKS